MPFVWKPKTNKLTNHSCSLPVGKSQPIGSLWHCNTCHRWWLIVEHSERNGLALWYPFESNLSVNDAPNILEKLSENMLALWKEQGKPIVKRGEQ